MIRPTMSHATNKDDLYKLMSEYATKLEKENAELKAHVETGWIDLLGEMKHQTNTSEDEGFRTGWNSCIHLLDQMAFGMMAKFNVVNSLAQHDKEVAVKAIESLSISPKSKAGCIGEFKVDYQDVCPTCWNGGHNHVCDICRGESDEDGYIDTFKDIPWDTQKEIFKRMLSNAKEYAIEQLQEQE